MQRRHRILRYSSCILFCAAIGCAGKPGNHMIQEEIQLTRDQGGHTINHTQVFSPDGQWIVYDTRNEDSGISGTGTIAMVNTRTGEIKELYHTTHQTAFGPGVGAATFSPVENRVMFLQGIRNSNKDNPYAFDRRTAIAIDIDNPFHPLFLDARNIIPPFTPGALRGGTHAHSWSGDGRWISFTYNDYVLGQLAKKDSSIRDLRTVAVMAPTGKVHVPENGMENNDGEFFSAVVAKVTATPAPASDQIDKAFDETWIGEKGYQAAGYWQKRAIAFQGNVRDADNKTKAEVFVVDIPDTLMAAPGECLEGTASTLPAVPAGVKQRRITFTPHGIEGPRHWLRSTANGEMIAFLAKDTNGIIQIFGVSPNGGKIEVLTHHSFSVEAGFNFSPDDKSIAYIGNHSILLTDIATGKTERLTAKFNEDEAPVGGVVWSNDGKMLAYNRYVDSGKGKFLQIFLLKR